ncbi:hypothetical protein B7Z00_00345 [Candidatus Saccharibacteria bacterium 32-50-10]|nr:MAG: hypothetical protein B7Z00_00345 [Candidatus Saccharibacteria bacterium 32-50-10]
MSIPYDPEHQQPIVPLPEQGETAEPLAAHPVTAPLGEVAVGSALQSDNEGSTTTVAVAELPSPDEIPSLLPELDRIASAHEHRYSDANTVYTKAKVAEQTPENKRTKEQQDLVDDKATMKKFAPYSSVYEYVYTPSELNGLTTQLRSLGEKSRPDFNGVEARVLDVVLSAIRSTDLVPANVRDIAKRAEKNAESRKGMQWDTLIKLAGEASKIIAERTERGHSSDYFVSVKDPEPTKYPDLTKVYQFVADAHALDVIGQRSVAVREARLDTFVTNCGVVNKWYAEVAPVLAQLPSEFKVGRFSAAREVKSMVESMNARLTGNVKSGRDKDYRMDPAGAISLQKKIGHTIEAIKTKLGGEVDETEIVPLDE